MQKTKAAIQAAYFALMEEKKTSRIAVSAVARRANIDRKTFYLHYASVEDIVREFGQDKIQELLFALEKKDFFSRPFDVGLLFREVNGFIEQDLGFFRRMAASDAYDLFWQELEEVLVCTMKEFDTAFLALDPAQLDVYARYLAAGFVTAYRRWLKNEIPLSLEELAQTVADVSYFGAGRVIPRANEAQP